MGKGRRQYVDPVAYDMIRRNFSTQRGYKSALKSVGTKILFISPEQEGQPPEELPSKSDQQMRKRRVRQRIAKRKSRR